MASNNRNGKKIIKNYISPLNINDKKDLRKICNVKKGIQGNVNSCYLDSLLMAMFPFTNIFDHILYRKRNKFDANFYEGVQEILKTDIVNPLRDVDRFYLPRNNIKYFRELFDNICGSKGFTAEEKDPEEFLTLLLTKLNAEPFIHLRNGTTFTYSIIIDDHIYIEQPNIEKAFKHALIMTNEEFSKIPNCLILQIPRYNKTTRKFKQIYPNLEIDITNFLVNGPKLCFMCQRIANKRCINCTKDFEYEDQYFCYSHLEKHKCVKNGHQLEDIKYSARIYEEFVNKGEIPAVVLNLFAVLCIERSHYVAFLKTGLNKYSPWVFYDSMSDRINEENIPCVEELPDFYNWFNETASNQLPKRSHELKNRLFTDGYLYFYQNVSSMYL